MQVLLSITLLIYIFNMVIINQYGFRKEALLY